MTFIHVGWFGLGWVLSIRNSIPHMFLHKQQMSEKLFGLTGYIKPQICCPPSPLSPCCSHRFSSSKCLLMSHPIDILQIFLLLPLLRSISLGFLPTLSHPPCPNIWHHNSGCWDIAAHCCWGLSPGTIIPNEVYRQIWLKH